MANFNVYQEDDLTLVFKIGDRECVVRYQSPDAVSSVKSLLETAGEVQLARLENGTALLLVPVTEGGAEFDGRRMQLIGTIPDTAAGSA